MDADRDPDDPLQLDIQQALLDHREEYTLQEMEMALQRESQAIREMISTSDEQEQNA